DPQLFFHRHSGKHFQYGHHDEAVAATGTELFDLLPNKWLQRHKGLPEKLQQNWVETTKGAQYETLVLQVYRAL
ncbi:MAG: hypothetical protein HN348_33390, partial [Proteobacteria bacterium]|nr:hypothetical protein [Pseudomonadota bacterium]